MRHSSLTGALLILASAGSALAGAGAQAHICVNLGQTPSTSFTVKFDPSNSQNKCMNQIGSATTVPVTKSGLTCGFVGYVEAKFSSSGGDLCATDESNWVPSYTTTGLKSEKSGSMKTRWRKLWGSNTNEISKENGVSPASICGSTSLCDNDKFDYSVGTVPDVYFIFQPDKQTSMFTEVIEGIDAMREKFGEQATLEGEAYHSADLRKMRFFRE